MELRGLKSALIFLVFSLIAVSGCTTSPVPSEKPEAQAQSKTEYLVGIEDQLSVSVWRNPELSVTGPVRPDGMITVPIVGDVPAAGRTPTEISKDIQNRLSKYIRNPQVVVSVAELVSHAYLTRIRVTGAVTQPISIPHRPGMKVLDAVLEAGGLTEFADPDRAKLYRKVRNQGKVYAIHLNQIWNKGDLSTNYDLFPGDIIAIPERRF